MRHIRLTIRHNPQDPNEDLKLDGKLRYDLWAHSRVVVDHLNPFTGTQQDPDGNFYFEFPTSFPEEVKRVLREYGYEGRVTMVGRGEAGLVCANCGYFTGFFTKCPNCGHRDIDPCPTCGHEVPRERYEHVSDDLYICPQCRRRVRLEINPNLCNEDGSFNEPMILVQDA
jgi:hypothetical protein